MTTRAQRYSAAARKAARIRRRLEQTILPGAPGAESPPFRSTPGKPSLTGRPLQRPNRLHNDPLGDQAKGLQSPRLSVFSRVRHAQEFSKMSEKLTRSVLRRTVRQCGSQLMRIADRSRAGRCGARALALGSMMLGSISGHERSILHVGAQY